VLSSELRKARPAAIPTARISRPTPRRRPKDRRPEWAGSQARCASLALCPARYLARSGELVGGTVPPIPEQGAHLLEIGVHEWPRVNEPLSCRRLTAARLPFASVPDAQCRSVDSTLVAQPVGQAASPSSSSNSLVLLGHLAANIGDRSSTSDASRLLPSTAIRMARSRPPASRGRSARDVEAVEQPVSDQVEITRCG